MREATEVVKRILQSEKATRLAQHGQYLLEVARDADKPQIRHAVERLFDVTVTRVNTQVCHGKWRRLSGRWGRRPDWKKAVVTVATGQKIELKS